MYGRDSPQLPWDSPRRRTTAGGLAGGEVEQTRRFSTGFNYAGMDGSSTSSGSGGFTNVPPGGGGGHSRGASQGGYSSGASGASPGNNGGGERTNRDKVNQIIQAFFMKAAMIIIQTRAQTKPVISKNGVRKVNKWVCWLSFSYYLLLFYFVFIFFIPLVFEHRLLIPCSLPDCVVQYRA